MSLSNTLTVQPVREKVIADCCRLVDDQVKAKSGLSGVAIKGAYALVKAVKPGFIAEVVDSLFDDWVAKIEPLYDEWAAAGGGQTLAERFTGQSAEVAERLLQVTDSRLTGAKSGSVKKAYSKLRPSAKRHVEEAVPALAQVLERHAAAPAAQAS